jgi:hypothetical protein
MLLGSLMVTSLVLPCSHRIYFLCSLLVWFACFFCAAFIVAVPFRSNALPLGYDCMLFFLFFWFLLVILLMLYWIWFPSLPSAFLLHVYIRERWFVLFCFSACRSRKHDMFFLFFSISFGYFTPLLDLVSPTLPQPSAPCFYMWIFSDAFGYGVR